MDYKKINKDSWNEKVDIHVKSDFYDNENFKKGKCSLNDIELEFLNNIKGKSILHLQCHFGQDSISLSRRGAIVTGVDISNKAIETAIELAKETNSGAQFICSDIYELPHHLDKQFDILFTSYGTIGWLPDMNKWANVVSRFLKPKGQFLIAEFHPIVWMFDDDFSEIKYNYCNDGPIIENNDGTYAEKDAQITQKHITWNHGLSEVINALIQENLEIKCLNEYDYSPYNCLNKMVEVEKGKFRIEHIGNKIPLVYAIAAQKKEI